jgi:hypothetical protein
MRGFFGQGFINMSLDSFAPFHDRAARHLLHAPSRVLSRLAVCVALAGPGCGTSDPDEASGEPGGSGGGQQGGGAGGALEAGSSPVVGGGGPVAPGNDASIQTSLDGGMPIPVEPPKPLPDAAVIGQPLGNAYAETEYILERPQALVDAYTVLTSGVGNTTRLFVNHLGIGDAGASVMYGAADVIDGGLVWQKPPAQPNTFPIGVSPTGERMFVSNPFKYILEARVPNPLNAASVFRVHLESEQTVWSATFSADYENITTGALYGIVTRAEAESRPLSIGAFECLAVCTDLGACTSGINNLAGLLDCNGAKPDADANGDGTNDGYRLIVSFKSRRVAPPVQ